MIKQARFVSASSGAWVSLIFLVWTPQALGACGDPPVQTPDEAKRGTHDFATGVRINWNNRTVEAEARVVLRDGPLELFACTPGTREHESILVVRGRPTHIYQAMGLVGLEPGSPVRYDEKCQSLVPPTGQALELSVRYRKNGAEQTIPAERWLADVEKHRTVDAVRWVFAGSRVMRDGRLGAEQEGTVACVVDFETALIAVGALHTADNASLWLAANTPEIPPVGTPCTLLIRAAPSGRIEVELATDGTLWVDGRTVTASDVKQMLRSRRKVEPKEAPVVLLVAPKVSQETVEAGIKSLSGVGIARDSLEIRKRAVKPSTTGP